MHQKFVRVNRNGLLVLLALIDLIVLIAMNNLSFGTGGKLAVYIFDTFVVGIMAYDFYVRYRKSQQGIRRYISINWHEFPSMIPIIFFSAAQILTHDDIIVVVILLRGLGVLYLLRMSRFAKNNLRIFGGNNILHVFVIFFVALTITTYSFYAVEHTAQNSQINTMGDALWWTIQTMSTATYGPSPITSGGEIVGSLTMIIGIGVTGVFISTLAVGLTRMRTRRHTSTLAYETKQTIKTKIDVLENLSEIDLQVLLSMIKSLHTSIKKSGLES